MDDESLLAKALIQGVVELARTKGVDHARVATKVNARGELVIALILPRDPMPLPPREGEPRRRGR